MSPGLDLIQRAYVSDDRLVRHYHQTRLVSSASSGPALTPRGRRGARFAMQAAALALAAAGVSGCAVSVPLGSVSTAAFAAAADEDATGAVPAAALERLLDPEDARRARAALATALDPQGNGASVRWDNPQSGASGVFAPVGKAFAEDARMCRRFTAEVAVKAGARTLRGLACAGKSGDWAIAALDAVTGKDHAPAEKRLAANSVR